MRCYAVNMIRSLLKLGFLAIVCILIYNYLFGTSTEKEQSKRVFKGVGTVFTEVRDLVRSERDKFDGGKYDKALNGMQNVLERLKNHAGETQDSDLDRKIAQLEKRKRELERQVEAQEQPKNTNTGFQKTADRVKQASEMTRQLESLTNDIQNLVNSVASPADQ
jgi:hypothetical protein